MHIPYQRLDREIDLGTVLFNGVFLPLNTVTMVTVLRTLILRQSTGLCLSSVSQLSGLGQGSSREEKRSARDLA